MKKENKFYGLLSVFAFITSFLLTIIHLLLNTAGKLTLTAKDKIIEFYNLDQNSTEVIMDYFYKLQLDHFPSYLSWSIDPIRNIPGLLAIICAIFGLYWAIQYISLNLK